MKPMKKLILANEFQLKISKINRYLTNAQENLLT